MKNRIRILSVIIALITLVSVFSLSVGATDVVAPTPDNPSPVDPSPDTGSDTPADPNPDQGSDTPADPNPDQGSDTPADPNPDQGSDTPADTNPNQGSDTTVDTDPNQGTVTPPTGGYVTNDDGFYYYDEDTMASSIENAAGSISEATDLYDSDINEAALKETKWDNITLDTSKSATDAMDFSAIKTNTEDTDDGQWILYAGYILIALAVVGILYFIIATTTYKKKLKKLNQRQQQYDSQRSRDDYGDHSDYPAASDYSRRTSHKRYAADGMGYAERKRIKADTTEINLPSHYKARH